MFEWATDVALTQLTLEHDYRELILETGRALWVRGDTKKKR